MTPNPIIIRNETEADIAAIVALTEAAFASLTISRHTEQFIIAALRAAKALTVSLVAEADGAAGWYGLGPVAVLPERQHQGIGSALIREGLARLHALHAKGCCLAGHPEYYTRQERSRPLPCRCAAGNLLRALL